MEDKEYLIPPAPKSDIKSPMPVGLYLVDTTPVFPPPKARKTLKWGSVECKELSQIIKMKSGREKGDAFRQFVQKLRQAEVDISERVWQNIKSDPILAREVRRITHKEGNYDPIDNPLYRKVTQETVIDTNMKVLAIDQSFTSSGIVVLAGDEMLHCEKFVSNTDYDTFARAFQVAEHAVELAIEYGCELIAMEGLAFSKNGNATRDLAGLQFVLVTKLRDEGFEVQIIPPNTVKKTATGKGNASKPEMCDALPLNIRAAFDSLGVKKTTGLLDLSDAYWIGKSVDLTTEDGV